LLFILLPFTIWMFDASVTSEISYAGFTSVFSAGWAGLPGWFFKLVVLRADLGLCSALHRLACATSGWT
jgi:hypothetical protein